MKKYIWIALFLLLIPLTQSAVISNDFEFNITHEYHGISLHEAYGTLNNTDTVSKRTFGFDMSLKDTNFDLTEINKLKISMWEPIDYEAIIYIDKQVTLTNYYFDGKMNISRQAILDNKNCWDNNGNEFYCNVTQQVKNGTIIKQKYGWVELKEKANEPQLLKTKSLLKTNYNNSISLKKGEVKLIKLEWHTPITKTKQGFGSAGYYEVIDNLTGISYDPYWNTSWARNLNISINETIGIKRPNEPIDFFFNITPVNTVTNCTLEIRVVDNSTLEINSQIYNETYSGGFCQSANVLFEAAAMPYQNMTYQIYYNNTGASVPKYTSDLFINTTNLETGQIKADMTSGCAGIGSIKDENNNQYMATSSCVNLIGLIPAWIGIDAQSLLNTVGSTNVLMNGTVKSCINLNGTATWTGSTGTQINSTICAYANNPYLEIYAWANVTGGAESYTASPYLWRIPQAAWTNTLSFYNSTLPFTLAAQQSENWAAGDWMTGADMRLGEHQLGTDANSGTFESIGIIFENTSKNLASPNMTFSSTFMDSIAPGKSLAPGNDSALVGAIREYDIRYWFYIGGDDEKESRNFSYMMNSKLTKGVSGYGDSGDITNPLIQYVSPTETNNTNLSRRAITINVTASDETSLANITVEIFNTTTALNSTSSTTSPLDVNFTVPRDGTYFFNATATDTAGNRNYTNTRNIFIDAIIPLIQYVSPTETNNTNLSRRAITINVTTTETNLVNITIHVFNTTSLINETTTNSTPNFMNITLPRDGTYFFNATATDTAGNRNYTSTRNILIDATIPVPSFVSPTPTSASSQEATIFIINISTTETNFRNVTVYVYTTSLINTTSSASNPFALTIFGAGGTTYTFNATVYDTTNNQNSTETRTVTVTQQADPTSSAGGGGGSVTNVSERKLSIFGLDFDLGDDQNIEQMLIGAINNFVTDPVGTLVEKGVCFRQRRVILPDVADLKFFYSIDNNGYLRCLSWLSVAVVSTISIISLVFIVRWLKPKDEVGEEND